jgi:hypothetical protein
MRLLASLFRRIILLRRFVGRKPSVHPAQGIALGIWAIMARIGPTGQMFPKFAASDWSVGPTEHVDGILRPQGDALGWENGCPFGAIVGRKSRIAFMLCRNRANQCCAVELGSPQQIDYQLPRTVGRIS